MTAADRPGRVGAALPVVLDVVALASLVGFALVLWPPACLLVLAAACLLVSWRRS